MIKQPNIVIFFTDQQRADTVGACGSVNNATPNLDKMAESGVTFMNNFTCQPVCGPARSCLMSGKYATRTGCYKNGIALPVDCDTVAKKLNRIGYKTAYVGKWHLATTKGQFDNHRKPIPEELRGGFKDYFTGSDSLESTSHPYEGYVFDKDKNKITFNKYRVDAITDYALDYINEQKKQEPFFMIISHLEPHHQNDYHRYVGPYGSKEEFKDAVLPYDLKGMGDYKKNYADYLGAIKSLDTNYQRVVDMLKEKDLLDNTVLIFTSDHACHFRTRNSEYKRSAHDASIKTPLVINGGAFTGGKKVNALTSIVDLPKTILNIAGVSDTDDLDGNNLVEVMEGIKKPEYVYIEISESHMGRAIRTERYTYEIACLKNNKDKMSSDTYSEYLLYDNHKDPHQTKNLIKNPQYNEVKEQLKKLIIKQVKDTENVDITITKYKVNIKEKVFKLLSATGIPFGK